MSAPHAMTEDHSFVEEFLRRLARGRVFILFVFHALVFTGAYAFSYVLRFEFVVAPDYIDTFRSSLLVVVGIQLLAGVIFGFYRGWWRYVGMADVVRLVFGLTSALAVLVVLYYAGAKLGIHERFVRTPRGVLLI